MVAVWMMFKYMLPLALNQATKLQYICSTRFSTSNYYLDSHTAQRTSSYTTQQSLVYTHTNSTTVTYIVHGAEAAMANLSLVYEDCLGVIL